MPRFSTKSLDRLAECGMPLQRLMVRAIAKTDFSVLCGYRGKIEQDAAYKKGTSKLKFPNSKHNKTPSQAIDIAPYPLDWKDINSFIELSKIIKETWDEMPDEEKEGWKLEWGGDWPSFKDYPHYQINK